MDGPSQCGAKTAVSPAVDDVEVRVWLFGALSALSAERPLVLGLAPGFTAGDVIEHLGDSLGDEFLSRVLAAPGEKFSHCRLFADGFAVEDLDAPIRSSGETTVIELILMIAPEGG